MHVVDVAPRDSVWGKEATDEISLTSRITQAALQGAVCPESTLQRRCTSFFRVVMTRRARRIKAFRKGSCRGCDPKLPTLRRPLKRSPAQGQRKNSKQNTTFTFLLLRGLCFRWTIELQKNKAQRIRVRKVLWSPPASMLQDTFNGTGERDLISTALESSIHLATLASVARM